MKLDKMLSELPERTDRVDSGKNIAMVCDFFKTNVPVCMIDPQGKPVRNCAISLKKICKDRDLPVSVTVRNGNLFLYRTDIVRGR